MKNFEIENTGDELVLKFNKQFFGNRFLYNLVKRIQIEATAQKSKFDFSILDLADEINQSWREKNGDDFLKNVKK